MDTYNTNRALICLDEVDEKYDSENEIVWQDDDYIRPIKDITGTEWEGAVFKDISPLIVLVHNRYKRSVLFLYEDAPGPRCAHTLTVVAPTKTHGPRLILFGGATAIEGGGGAGIRLAGVTNTVHSYDVLSKKWIKIKPAGEPPSPRAAHTAAAVGTMVVFQGGIGPAGHSTDDLYVLDMTNDKFNWHRVVV
ncbi:hypothetical protein POM88_001199 [Heracleum sosnowskyi]|uniref:Uncharacterized protein n=1 Tax=Heracleum sosnowskyi TaxID=360622 RepID=A0AAD8JDL9_9APIA|nr:hypothetical protein POM88_001199 [Heracleum sosnowskyi]